MSILFIDKELRSGIAGGTRLTVPAELREQVFPTLYFGPTDDCSISAFQNTGMAFTDPDGFVSGKKRSLVIVVIVEPSQN